MNLVARLGTEKGQGKEARARSVSKSIYCSLNFSTHNRLF